MNINPCIIGTDGKIVGCVTDGVLERFSDAFVEICSISDDLPNGWLEAIDRLADAFRDSLEHYSPAFLSELRRLSEACRGIAEEEFTKRLLAIRRDLTRYCRSKAVRNEAFSAATKFFEEIGIRYQGSGIQGIEDDECAFEYNNVTVGIKIRVVEDLYRFWLPVGIKRATVYCKGRRYRIEDEDCSPEHFRDAIIACIGDDADDMPYETPCESGEKDDVEAIVNALLEVAKMLLRSQQEDSPSDVHLAD